MDDIEIISRLNDIFKDLFDNESLVITVDTVPDDIAGWDSLMHMNILSAIEEEFGVTFDMDEMMEIQNVRDIIDAIRKKAV